MGKTGTTSDFRDALFVGSTYGPHGITVAVRIGFDDNRTLGDKETGGRAALPIFREIMLHSYQQKLVGPVPSFPREIENGIDRYLVQYAARQPEPSAPPPAQQTRPAQQGDIYRWTDEHAVTTWTDQWDKIPVLYRAQAHRLGAPAQKD
jgi:membrane carboxypeptidase/penicillin-binding protein